ncbi:PhoX family phosphatase [Nocardioides sp. Arc9.136]|uniref:PhoX family protein n=1 Tax=Nocardioides sp. Arc9.136 TaxID=2996826 RepID=UPI0026653EC1|nr:PhoX family phosphatase [Nocardioides sp. Arc9.136]WKN49139.1 PhoX family phosphatase [Nocardioides sp. Arc9.136]
MTTASREPRTLLPLLTSGPHGSRSHLTCQFRCGNACDQPVPNTSTNGHVRDEISKAVARRSVLQGAAVGTGAMVLAGLGSAPAAAVPATTPAGVARAAVGKDLGRTSFRPVAPNKRDAVVVPEGFRSDVVASWGDPVEKGAPRFDVRRQTPDSAAKQFGYNCDYVGVLPLKGDRALLVVNHEYTDPNLMFPTDLYPEDTQKEIEILSHGMSVLEIKRGRTAGSWLRVSPSGTRHNRRISTRTAFAVTGPAAGDPRLRTSADPSGRKVMGTLNNCAGGMTPWGTVLSGEENFNQYFDASGDLDPRYADSYKRIGVTGAGRGWSSVDPRFDLTTEPHEPFRFGWVVELDPTDRTSTPRKHSMLGRFKHEGANVALAKDGRAVAYMGDDERGDYLYKFVSRDKMKKGRGAAARRHNLTLLTRGTLYVAKLTGDGTQDGYDGTGEWIRLTSDTTSYVEGMSVADVLIDTRLAADKVGPTKMDRPEDVEPNPVTGKVYVALTNNSNRGTAALPVDEANPVGKSMTRPALGEPLREQSGNRNGYVLELTPARGDHASTTFTWDLMLVCGDPAAQETYFAGFDKSQVSPISCPDNVSFDSEGNLWISTDGNVLGSNDGIFRVPTKGALRGKVEQFVTVPRGAEACGPLITDQDRSLFVAVQHPGEVDGATFETPASTWPHTDDFPRPSVVVVHKHA